MEKAGDLDMGPRPAGLRHDPATQISAARAHVLQRLANHPELVTVADLATELDQHPNTIREHLDALVDTGLAERTTAAPKGRGRPAILFRALPPEASRPQVREYATLAGALAGHIHRTSPDPRADAIAAGVTWGLELASPGEAGQDAAARESLRVFEALDFTPVTDDGRDIALHTCPLLDAARRFPDVVCNVHLGIVQGIYSAREADGTPAVLFPFAEPGACRLHLPGPVENEAPESAEAGSEAHSRPA